MDRSRGPISHAHETVNTEAGSTSPFGVSIQNGKYNFAVLVHAAAHVNLCLYDLQGSLHKRLALHCDGEIWHIAVETKIESLLYCYEIVREGAEPLKLADP